jgi:hypothetical protein
VAGKFILIIYIPYNTIHRESKTDSYKNFLRMDVEESTNLIGLVKLPIMKIRLI